MCFRSRTPQPSESFAYVVPRNQTFFVPPVASFCVVGTAAPPPPVKAHTSVGLGAGRPETKTFDLGPLPTTLPRGRNPFTSLTPSSRIASPPQGILQWAEIPATKEKFEILEDSDSESDSSVGEDAEDPGAPSITKVPKHLRLSFYDGAENRPMDENRHPNENVDKREAMKLATKQAEIRERHAKQWLRSQSPEPPRSPSPPPLPPPPPRSPQQADAKPADAKPVPRCITIAPAPPPPPKCATVWYPRTSVQRPQGLFPIASYTPGIRSHSVDGARLADAAVHLGVPARTADHVAPPQAAVVTSARERLTPCLSSAMSRSHSHSAGMASEELSMTMPIHAQLGPAIVASTPSFDSRSKRRSSLDGQGPPQVTERRTARSPQRQRSIPIASVVGPRVYDAI